MFATFGRRRFIERGQPDASDTPAREADLSCGALGKIDSSAVNVRAAIVDPDHDRSSVVEIRHTRFRSYRESARGCRQSIFRKISPLLVRRPSKPGPYHEASVRWPDPVGEA
jgi:hypothetical protein